MAFGDRSVAQARDLKGGDELFLYTTRGCFANPTRDRGRVIGRAAVIGAAEPTDPPIEIARRVFTHACDLKLKSLAVRGTGVEMAPLVPGLSSFPNKAAWNAYLRRTLLKLSSDDARRLEDRLMVVVSEPLPVALDTYTPNWTRQVRWHTSADAARGGE
jgi:hypothetical protein